MLVLDTFIIKLLTLNVNVYINIFMLKAAREKLAIWKKWGNISENENIRKKIS